MAGGTTPNRSGGIIEGINMTPLVDIMLVLLVIFIVTAKILVTPALPMELPKATKTEDVQMIFAVTVPTEGATQINGKPVGDDAAITVLAKSALAADAELRAVIQADGAVPHSRVLATLDALRQAGVVKIAFGAKPAEPRTP